MQCRLVMGDTTWRHGDRRHGEERQVTGLGGMVLGGIGYITTIGFGWDKDSDT